MSKKKRRKRKRDPNRPRMIIHAAPRPPTPMAERIAEMGRQLAAHPEWEDEPIWSTDGPPPDWP